jgi:signal transduction histidine kinase
VGFGLTIAQRAVVLHQGRIGAENVNPGLRVTIEIPIVQSETAAIPAPEAVASASRDR